MFFLEAIMATESDSNGEGVSGGLDPAPNK